MLINTILIYLVGTNTFFLLVRSDITGDAASRRVHKKNKAAYLLEVIKELETIEPKQQQVFQAKNSRKLLDPERLIDDLMGRCVNLTCYMWFGCGILLLLKRTIHPDR